MIDALRISFDLKNTYRVNCIIYSIQQIPLIRRILPDSLYKSRGLKIFANVLAVLWEILTAFIGKLLYLLLLVSLAGNLYKGGDMSKVSLHILLFLTIIGSFMNTYMFNPSNDKYYAMILMRMDAGKYTLSNYFYMAVKTIVGFMPFTILFGKMWGLPVFIRILLPFFVMGMKLTASWIFLLRYEKTGACMNENLPPKAAWPLTAVLLLAAYGLPWLGVTVPFQAFMILLVLVIAAGLYSLVKIWRFKAYREMYQLILSDKKTAIDIRANTQKAVEEQSRKSISMEEGFESKKKGFEYFNELFIRRHKKILWRSAFKVSIIAAVIVAGFFVAVQVNGDLKSGLNKILMTFLPYFVFIMYAVNRGTYFTQVLFMNCDHSMLTYAFYKKPEFILKLFRIRLREIVKVNLLPAAVIGLGLALLLYSSGGSENPVNYLILIVSILFMSIFFSVHYLTCYYLLQPYNVNTEMKSATYRIVLSGTYFVCFLFMKLRMNTLVFGMMVTLFCALYCVIACVLVYKFASRTFRLRN